MLTWALHSESGEVVRASALRALDKVRRPLVICPACRRIVFAARSQLGTEFFRHKAHPEPCYAATGEGALHLEAKRRVIEQLERLALTSAPLVVELACVGCPTSFHRSIGPLSPSDTIRQEHWTDPAQTRRPDVALLREGTPLLYVEVFATNACDEAKWRDLQAIGTPTVEVRARKVVGGEGSPAWDAASPLPVELHCNIADPPLCDGCLRQRAADAAQDRAELERARADRARREEKERVNAALRAASPDAKHVVRVHEVLFADIHWANGRLTRSRGLAVEVDHFGRRSGYFANSKGRLVSEVVVFPAPIDALVRGTRNAMVELLDAMPGHADYSFPPRLSSDRKRYVIKGDGPRAINAALRLSPPRQAKWWLPETRRWEEAREFDHLVEHFVPVPFRGDVEEWRKSGLIPTSVALPFAGSRETVVIVPFAVSLPLVKVLREQFLELPSPYADALRRSAPRLAAAVEARREQLAYGGTRRWVWKNGGLHWHEPAARTR